MGKVEILHKIEILRKIEKLCKNRDNVLKFMFCKIKKLHDMKLRKIEKFRKIETVYKVTSNFISTLFHMNSCSILDLKSRLV